MKTRVTVKPRDLRVGDQIQQLNPDLSIGYRTIRYVEKVTDHRARRTVYRVGVEGGTGGPFYWGPNKEVEVLR